jgi:hypothetical protein
MRYGIISSVLFGIAFISFIIAISAYPIHAPNKTSFWNPHTDSILAVLLIVILAFDPVSFVFGVVGIIFDKKKLLSILAICISGISTFCLYYDCFIRHAPIDK